MTANLEAVMLLSELRAWLKGLAWRPPELIDEERAYFIEQIDTIIKRESEQ